MRWVGGGGAARGCPAASRLACRSQRHAVQALRSSESVAGKSAKDLVLRQGELALVLVIDQAKPVGLMQYACGELTACQGRCVHGCWA